MVCRQPARPGRDRHSAVPDLVLHRAGRAAGAGAAPADQSRAEARRGHHLHQHRDQDRLRDPGRARVAAPLCRERTARRRDLRAGRHRMDDPASDGNLRRGPRRQHHAHRPAGPEAGLHSAGRIRQRPAPACACGGRGNRRRRCGRACDRGQSHLCDPRRRHDHVPRNGRPRFRGLRRPRRIVSVAPWIWRLAFSVLHRWLPNANAAMGTRMSNDMVFDSGPAKNDFGWHPRPFRPVFD